MRETDLFPGRCRLGFDLNIPHRPDSKPVVECFAGEDIHVVACD